MAQQTWPLTQGVDVFGLGDPGQLVLVARQAAEENTAADAQDGGAPAEAVGPGVVIVTLEDQLVELDRVDDESDDLNNHCRETPKTRCSGNWRLWSITFYHVS